jgi:hypothetical protein
MNKLLIQYLLVSVLALVAMWLALKDGQFLMFIVAMFLHATASGFVLMQWQRNRAK